MRTPGFDIENAAAPNAAMGQGAPSCRPARKISAAQAPKAREGHSQGAPSAEKGAMARAFPGRYFAM